MRSRTVANIVAAIVIFVALCGTADAVLFYPISSVASDTAVTDFYPAARLIEGAGVGFDAAEPHNRTSGLTWVTNAPNGGSGDYFGPTPTPGPRLVFDLGADVPLSEVSVWGYADANANGASDFNLRFATASDGTGAFGTSISQNPTFTAIQTVTPRQSFSFPAVSARYVELTPTDNFFGINPPGGDRVGLGEVAFQTAPNNLIGHYPLDTITGGATTPDTTGINGAGTLNGGVTLSAGAGKMGGAFSFNNSNGNFVGITDAGFGLDAFTASVWFQPANLDGGDPLANWVNTGPSPRTFLMRSGGGALQTYLRSGGAQIGGNNAFSTESLTTTDFNHAVITYDGQNLQAYLNGEPSTNVFSFASPLVLGEGVKGTAAIGGRGNSEGNMNGLVDDVAFWDQTLTGGHAAAIHNLADTPALNYDAYQTNELFRVYSGAIPDATIGGHMWTQAAGMGGGAGDVVDVGGGNYFPNLDGSAGVAAIPVPVRYEVAGDGNIGTETWTGAQVNEVIAPLPGAKVIRVDQNLGDQLNIAEVQAFETGTGDNVALASVGGVATQSSTGWGGLAPRAIDGNTNGVWGGNSVQHTNNGGYKWWQVELPNSANLDSVHIWGRTDGCCDQRLNNFNLVIEDELNNVLYDVQHTGVGTSPGSNRLIDVSTLVSADLMAILNPHDLGAGYTYVFELGSADMIEVGNPDPSIFDTYLNINNADIEVELSDPKMTFAIGDTFDLLDADFIQGGYHSLILPYIGEGLMFYHGNFLKDGTLHVMIPEPATLSLLGLGLLAARRRRRR